MTKNKKGGGGSKKRSIASASGGGGGNNTAWDETDHVLRQEKQLSKKAKKQETITPKEQWKEERRNRLTTKLTHDSREKRESSKLRLNITKTQRDIEKLRNRLKQWDDDEEKALLEKQEKERLAKLQPKKKKGRLGPETWKLKGAARPAWQVCEFDVRYECPHQKAHDQAKAKARRVRNLLVLYKGSFGQPHHQHSSSKQQQQSTMNLSYPHRRQFLALLMQYGLLNQEAKKYKTARVAFLECLELDGIDNPITDARCHLMRLYLQVNRPQSVYQLWTSRLSSSSSATTVTREERSCWVLYSVALVEYVRWKEFGESTRLQAELALQRAIRGNVYCAYYLAFADFFHKCMEYTDEIENVNGDDKPLEEAIEYCDSEQMGMWIGTDGALDWLHETILRALHGQKVANGALTKTDLEWNTQLQILEKETRAQREEEEKDVKETEDADDKDENDDDDAQDDEEEVDTLMYAGQFRTTMEMLEANGSFAHVPPPIVEDEQVEEEEEEEAERQEDDNNSDSNSNKSDDSNSDTSGS